MPKTFKRTFAIVFAIAIAVCALAFMSSCEKSEKVCVGSLYGPTSVSLLQLTGNENYELKAVAQTDALVADMASEKLDIALLPSNLAANMYQKMNGGVKVIDVNTTGVLKFISQDASIDSLKYKTLYATGKGTVVQATLDIMLAASNMTERDINLQFKSDASEVIAYIKNDPSAVGLVNEPQASVALTEFSELHQIWDINDIWKGIFGPNSDILTAVTIVRTKYLEENQAKVDRFIQDHKSSINFVNSRADVAVGIFNKFYANTGINATERSILNSNLKFIEGEEMHQKLEEFLNKLYTYDHNLVGGQMPDEKFYYYAGQNLEEDVDNG